MGQSEANTQLYLENCVVWSELIVCVCQEMVAIPQIPELHRDVLQGCATDPRSVSPSQAANNLIILGREEAGAERIFQNNGVSLLLQLIETKNPELVLAAVRTLSEMCTGHKARVSSLRCYCLAPGGVENCHGLMLVSSGGLNPTSKTWNMIENAPDLQG